MLSTTERTPCLRASDVMWPMSLIFKRGLVGDSRKINFGFWPSCGLSEASRASGFEKSTSSKSMPKFEKTEVNNL